MAVGFASTARLRADLAKELAALRKEVDRLGNFEQTVQLVRGLASCAVRNSSNTSIVTATFTTLTWDTEEFDTDGFHSTTSNTHLLTAPASGRYLVLASVAWAASGAGGARVVRILGGGQQIVAWDDDPSAGVGLWQNLMSLQDLAAGAGLYLQVYQASGGNLDCLGFSHFSLTRV